MEADDESCINEGWVKNVKFDAEKCQITFTANVHVEIDDWQPITIAVPMESTFPKGTHNIF